MTNFTDYSNHLKNSEIPFIGMLSWYSVPESARITHKDFLYLVESSGAPIKTPDLPKPADVFRRACNNAKLLKITSPIPDEYYNYTMRDASYDDAFVFRALMRETVDTKGKSISFEQMGTAIFAKESFSITFQMTNTDKYTDEMCEAVKDYVRDNSEVLPAIAVREAARRAVERRLRGTRVRPGGGVYFTSMEKATALEAVDKVINSVPNASFHIMPLIDDTKQRLMLKEAFEDESVETTKSLIGEVADLLKSDKDITASKFKDIQGRFLEQKLRLKEYQSLLSDNLALSEAQLDICEKQIVSLLDKAT